tara:strand:- start:788 stop:1153 length:366 start_codon:yes stop_codon:yes gene_type:complete
MSSFRRTFTVKRKGEGSYDVSGFFETTGSDTELEIKASVHPVTGSDMKLLPENRREEEVSKLYTTTELIGIVKGSGLNPDLVIIDGYYHEVIRVLPWKNGVINHYKVFVAKRVTNDPSPTK